MEVRQLFSCKIHLIAGEMIAMKLSFSNLLTYEIVICVSKEPTNMILCYIIELINSTEPCTIESNFGMWLG